MSTLSDTALSPIARSHRVDVIYAFGSRAREVAVTLFGGLVPSDHASSDVDIGVQPGRGHHLTARDRVRLALELEEALSVCRVDLVVLPEANAFLAAEIVRGELLYARDLDQEAALQLYHLRRAGDLAPFFREQWRQTVGSDL